MRDFQTKANVGAVADSISATRFGAGEFNALATELENAVDSSDQTLAPADGTGEVDNQLAMAMAIYGAGGAAFHLDTGAVNAYVLNPVSPKESPPAYFDGFTVTFAPGNANSGASTVNIASLGVKSITELDGTALVGGEITGLVTIKYNLTDDRFEIVKPALISQNAISGLVCQNGTDTQHDIDIGTGEAMDSTNGYVLRLTSTLTKQIDAAWAAGTNAGGLFSGTVAANTTYFVFLIRKDSDGSIDAGFDTSSTAANIPGGYTAFRLIDALITDGSANIINFYAWPVSNRTIMKYYNAIIQDLSTTTPATSRTLVALTVPNSDQVTALVISDLITATVGVALWVMPTTYTDVAPTNLQRTIAVDAVTTGDLITNITHSYIPVDSSGQIAYRSSSAGPIVQFQIKTAGYLITR